MPSKSATKKTETASPAPAATVNPGSALAALQALGSKKPAPVGSPLIVRTMTDPAISGATKKPGSTSVVLLGLDQGFSDRAKQCAQLAEALENAQASFAVLQTECRDYGAEKRVAYNDTFNADVTTVCIPYEVETPTGPEKKYVQAICTSKYSVQQDVIRGSKEQIGEFYDRLFEEQEVRTLKPNAEELLRNLFIEQFGMSEDAVNTTLDNLRDVKVTVKAKDSYEKESRAVPEAVKTILDQGVKRQQPGLKFR